MTDLAHGALVARAASSPPRCLRVAGTSAIVVVLAGWQSGNAAVSKAVAPLRCPGFESLSRRRFYCACVVKPRRALLWSVRPAGHLCAFLSAACELGARLADELT